MFVSLISIDDYQRKETRKISSDRGRREKWKVGATTALGDMRIIVTFIFIVPKIYVFSHIRIRGRILFE